MQQCHQCAGEDKRCHSYCAYADAVRQVQVSVKPAMQRRQRWAAYTTREACLRARAHAPQVSMMPAGWTGATQAEKLGQTQMEKLGQARPARPELHVRRSQA